MGEAGQHDLPGIILIPEPPGLSHDPKVAFPGRVGSELRIRRPFTDIVRRTNVSSAAALDGP